MNIYLIRHGRQCSRLCNVNVDLAPEGRRQAALLGERLASSNIDAVYSSDFLRAVQTAEEANRWWHVPHMIEPGLQEISFGEMEGMSDKEIALTYASFQEEQNKLTADLPYPGGECAGDVIKRAYPVLCKIALSGYDNAAVVTHGGVIRSLVSHILRMDPAASRLVGSSLENCGITELRYEKKEGRFTLIRLNDYAHLEQEPSLLRSSWADQEN